MHRIMGLRNWTGLAILATSASLMGCTGLAEHIATHLVDNSIKRQQLLTIIEGDVALFRHCLKERGGACKGNAQTVLPQSASTSSVTPVKPGLSSVSTELVKKLPTEDPSRKAAAAINHPVLATVSQLHNQLRGLETTPSSTVSISATHTKSGATHSTVKMNLSLGKSRDFMDLVHQSTAAGGWSALANKTSEAVARAPIGSAEHQRLTVDHRRATFIDHYIKAYFKNGHFVAVDFKIDASQAQSDLAAKLKEISPQACVILGATSSTASTPSTANPCQNLAKKIYDLLRGSDSSIDSQLFKISQTGFVSRDASFSAQFPTFEIDIDPLARHLLTLTTTQDGKTVSKMNFTTIGTQLVRVVLEAVFDAHEGLPAVQNSTARTLGDDSLPLFDPATGHVSADDFTAMTRTNNRVEAATGAIVDRLIKGIGPFSLNNEALEDLFVVLVTTSVRKAVEKASWCWYACNLDVDAKAARTAIASDVKKVVHKELDQVKLALQISP